MLPDSSGTYSGIVKDLVVNCEMQLRRNQMICAVGGHPMVVAAYPGQTLIGEVLIPESGPMVRCLCGAKSVLRHTGR